jgi:hypothetical protein
MNEPAAKTCFKCSLMRPIEEFYKHPRMADGRLNKCKTCTKSDVKKRYERLDGCASYERKRAVDPKRKEQALKYQRARRAKHPEKTKANRAVYNALQGGRLTRGPCEVCGTTVRVQAHHDDYSKALDVRWLCFTHHREDAHGQTVRSPQETARAAVGKTP